MPGDPRRPASQPSISAHEASTTSLRLPSITPAFLSEDSWPRRRPVVQPCQSRRWAIRRRSTEPHILGHRTRPLHRADRRFRTLDAPPGTPRACGSCLPSDGPRERLRRGSRLSIRHQGRPRRRHLHNTPPLPRRVLASAVPDMRVEDKSVARPSGHDNLVGVPESGLRQVSGHRRRTSVGTGYDPCRPVRVDEVVEHPQHRDAVEVVDPTWRTIAVQRP